MDLTRLEDLRLALKLAGIRPNADLGQNFLVDRQTLESIVDQAELSKEDTVLEVGPGLGTMTELLAAKVKKVVAVETDDKLAKLLQESALDNTSVINEDILTFDFRRLPTDYKVVANIPYYLTSKILRLLIENSRRPKLMVLLIQKEVAQRVCAQPGDLSILALSVQYYAKPEVVAFVGREKFWPSPAVDSAILKVTLYDQPLFPAEPAKLFRLIKAGFGEKRKMLKNSLAGGLNATDELVTQTLKDANINSSRRAQELSLSDWSRLYNEAIKHGLI